MDLLKDIRYIFQVPLEWFKKVDARVFGDHPGSGIKFEQANDGSRAFMVDFDVLDKRYSGGGGEGTVTAVDGVGPNASGNVVLNALKEEDLGVTVARQSDLETAQQTADDAQTAAESAGTSAESAATAAANAQTTANNAATAAGNAVTTANSASQTASSAAQAASTAQTAANNAATAAATAQSTANGAAGVAAAAQQAVAGKADAQHSHGNLTSDGVVNVNYPSGGCLAAIASNGMLTAASFGSGAAPYVTAENVRKVLSTCNLETAGTVTLKGAQVKLATASKWVKTDASGNLTTAENDPITPPTTAPTEDKVATVKKNGTAVSWEPAGGNPENPTSKTTANITGEGTAAANATSWTFAGTNGLQLTVCSRVMYNHTSSTPVLYGFYRTWTFDKRGRLYSVSAETRYEIDTPVVGNLTT